MRAAILGSGILIAVGYIGNASAARKPKPAPTAAVERACTVEDCFYERDVRDFEVIDKTTVIVYIGSQRCPFRIELSGTFCDLTFAPELYFRSHNDVIQGGSRSPAEDVFGNNRGDRNLRVCANDLAIDVDGGSFTETRSADQPGDPFGTSRRSGGQRYDRFGQARSQCQVSNVASMTDDQLVELYVTRGLVPPPPPMGTGEIEVGEQEEPAVTPTPPQNESESAPEAANAAGDSEPTIAAEND